MCLNEVVRIKICYFSSLALLSLPSLSPGSNVQVGLYFQAMVWFTWSGFRALWCPASPHQPGSVLSLRQTLGPSVQRGLTRPLPGGRVWMVEGTILRAAAV